MSTIFIKTETSTSVSWADVNEGLNTYYAGPLPALDELLDPRSKTDQEQQINTFVKIDNKIGLYRGVDSSLAISVASPTKEQTLGIKHIDMEKVKELLTSGVKAVYFGYMFNGDAASQVDVVDNSFLFGRNQLSNMMTNFETGEDLVYDSKYAVAIWAVFYKIKDCDIYYVVTNDNLLDPTIIRQSFLDDPEHESNDVISILTTHDGNFRESVFRPRVVGGDFIGDNIIATSKDSFEVETLGLSKLHFLAGKQLSDDELPEFNLEVSCSVPFEQNKQRITVTMGKAKIAKLSYRWVTGTELDSLASKHEMPRYDFVIVKI